MWEGRKLRWGGEKRGGASLFQSAAVAAGWPRGIAEWRFPGRTILDLSPPKSLNPAPSTSPSPPPLQRHWAAHGPPLLACCLGQMGTLAPALQAQAEAVEREQDGVRKALGLHSLLRTLVNHKLDALVTLLSPKSLAAVRGGQGGGEQSLSF